MPRAALRPAVQAARRRQLAPPARPEVGQATQEAGAPAARPGRSAQSMRASTPAARMAARTTGRSTPTRPMIREHRRRQFSAQCPRRLVRSAQLVALGVERRIQCSRHERACWAPLNPLDDRSRSSAGRACRSSTGATRGAESTTSERLSNAAKECSRPAVHPSLRSTRQIECPIQLSGTKNPAWIAGRYRPPPRPTTR